jgi:ADP-ribose pyrophosphatase
MEKPQWRRRASTFVVNSPHLRLRVDQLELPDGTRVDDYYVRESAGFVVVFAVTPDERVVLVRQYRYGNDSIHLELPAGGLHDGEDPAICAARELVEETGYEAERLSLVTTYFAEPVRATTKAWVFAATRAVKRKEPQLEPTEVLHVELAPLTDFREMLRDGRIDSGHVLVAGYRCLDELEKL